MALYVVHPGNYEEPEEVASSRTVTCATCGAEFDEEEDTLDFDTVGCSIFCTDGRDGKPSCFAKAQTEEYRAQLAETLTDVLKEARREICAFDRDYPQALMDDCEDHPATILEDFIERLKAFGEGRDSGWRNGLMLSNQETWEMRHEKEREFHSKDFHLRWEMGMVDGHSVPKPSEYIVGSAAKELAHVTNELSRFKAFEARTDKGVTA